MGPLTRRHILQGLACAAPLLHRADAQVTPAIAQFRPEIEPLVALLERTPRERCAEMLVEQLRRGVSYRQLMAALFLAGIRNVNPRPPGFALHCVFIIHSAHLLSLEAPADVRLLPLFYALDNFKAAQERDARNPAGDYTMRALAGPMPAPERASAELVSAMEAWDPERAERAAVALARHRSAAEAFATLWRYGARDYRNIGHKAIYVANAERTLHAIGWQHAEPVLRSLVLALLDFGREQKVNGYAFEDQCYSANVTRVKEAFLKRPWDSAAPSREVASLLAAIREATPNEACGIVAQRLVKSDVTPASVWDAVHLAAAELRMRAHAAAAITAVHAVTSANALHHACNVAPDPETRYLMMLQAVGWMGQFHKWAGMRENALRSLDITAIEPAEDQPAERLISATLADIPEKLDAAGAGAFRLSKDAAVRQAFLAAATRLVVAKADEVHYYKYLAAILEDLPLVTRDWQPHITASIVYYAKGSGHAEPAAMKQAREALRALPA